MRKILLIFLAFYSLASLAANEATMVPGTAIKSFATLGGPPPREVPSMSTVCNGPGKGVQPIPDGIKTQLPALNTTRQHGTTTVPKLFLQSYDYFLMRSKTVEKAEKSDIENVFDAKNIKSIYVESPAHLHYFYETDVGLAMLSRWDFCKEIVSTSVALSNINLNINGNYGALNLIHMAENKNECRWNAWLDINDKAIHYAMMVKTKCPNGRPDIHAESVIRALKMAIPH